jgi:hypothetical protein
LWDFCGQQLHLLALNLVELVPKWIFAFWPKQIRKKVGNITNRNDKEFATMVHCIDEVATLTTMVIEYQHGPASVWAVIHHLSSDFQHTTAIQMIQ